MHTPADGDGRVGLLADPDLAPAEVGRYLASALPERLAAAFEDMRQPDVTVAYERLPAGTDSQATMLDHAASRRRQWGADVVVCITDLPLVDGGRPVAADIDAERGVALISLPAIGGVRLRRGAGELVTIVVAELTGRTVHRDDGTGPKRRWLRQRSTSGRLRSVVPEVAPVGLRLLAPAGRLRLLFGMVRANRPWRLATGLSSALIAAFAISAFFLINSSVWMLATSLSPLRLAVLTAVSMATLVGWLIVNHRMWEPAGDHGLSRLYNAATVVTLSIGVGCLFIGQYLVLFGVAALMLAPSTLASTMGGTPTVGVYADIAWLTTSAATLGGALGSSLDSDDAVRAAAYSYRERQRQTRRDRDEDQEDE